MWDELRTSTGALRSAWQRFAHALPAPQALPNAPGAPDMADDLDRRVGQVAQRIKLDGVTHNVFSEEAQLGNAARAW